MVDSSDFSFQAFLSDKQVEDMEEKGYTVVHSSQPDWQLVNNIEEIIGKDLYGDHASDRHPTYHFEGVYGSALWRASRAFMEYDVNNSYMRGAYINASQTEVRYDAALVVRRRTIDDEPRPLMAGPKDYPLGKAILLIRPLREWLGPVFLWVYLGSHWLTASEFKQQHQEGRLRKEVVSIPAGDILVLSSRVWVEFPKEAGTPNPVFLCRAYCHGLGSLIFDVNDPGYVCDDDVVPFTRSDLWKFGKDLK
ncbi:hypothetical protein Plec18167_006149 [Paecilomyces lecythidis]|uniref:Uncharacterized protein n=1 Tax=Paecilomyces lecythidis TaxID=3004212 RepID=A0ABR3XCE9_9EURO